MQKQILKIDDFEKVKAIETAEEANKYLYEAELVKKIVDDNYYMGFEDALDAVREARKKIMLQYDIKGGNVMEEAKTKKSFDFGKAAAIGTAFGGFASGTLAIYQIIVIRRQQKQLKKQLEEQSLALSGDDAPEK